MPRDPALRDELLGMAASQLAAAADAPSEALAARLAELVHEYGWPGLRLVGVDGADAVWLLAHYADHANETRRAWLPALSEAVASGDADPRHLAALTDRIAAVAGEPQTYGELVAVAADGEPEPLLPVHDPGSLDDRRRAIGLPTLAEEAPWRVDGDLVPYGPDRGSSPVNQWPMVLEGHVSVEAALAAGVRRVHRIWARRPGDRRLGRLRKLARERDVLIDEVEPELIDELAAGRSHGGVIGLVGARRTLSVQSLLAGVGERPLIVMLDGIEDPFNFGQAVRALYAAGVDGLVIRRSWETAVGTVARASAGATELMPTATTDSAEAAAAASRLAGLRVACAVAETSAVELHDADLTGGLFLLVGGERRGVTRSFVAAADVRVRIGYGRQGAPELGAAAAASVIAFEALRQRRRGPGG